MQRFIKKRLLPIALSCALMFSVVPAASAASGFDNFKKSKTYSEGQFTDVKSDAWYHESVKQAYELGLMSGTSVTSFNPTGNITMAEVVTMACCLHMIYYGETPQFKPSSTWYEPYMEYAAENGIINRKDELTYPNLPSTRHGLAYTFSRALPEECFVPINNVTSIPDVTKEFPTANAIYNLYNAGILSGVDEKGTFRPYSHITRAEVATIVSNIALPELRKEFQLSSGVLDTDKEDTVTGDVVTEDVTTEDVAKKEETKLSVSQTSLTISKETTVTVTASGDDITVVKACDSDVIETRWGDWNGDDLPLIITPKKNGTATIKVYIDKETNKSETIIVTVTGISSRELKASDIDVALKIPHNGTLNSYAYLEIKNYTDTPILLPTYASFNGWLCSQFHGDMYPLEGNMMATITYYRDGIVLDKYKTKDMYLDNNSKGYLVFEWNDEQYYAEFGVNGITTFYKGNARGPA